MGIISFVAIPFMILRKYAGGFHADAIGKCFVWTIPSLIVATIVIGILSPIDNEDNQLSKDDRPIFKMICWLIMFVCYLILFLLYCIGCTKLLIAMSVGIILVAILQLVDCCVHQLM